MTDRDRDILVMTITALAEARNQGADGLRAQAHSVVNRHKAGKWYSRKSLSGCCLAPYAYSCYTAADQNDTVAAEILCTDPLWQTAESEVRWAIDGTTQDPTLGATHYYAAGTKEPTWVSGKNDRGEQVAPPAVFTVQIGAHRFYKDVA